MQRTVGLHARTPAPVVWPVLGDDPVIRFFFEAFLSTLDCSSTNGSPNDNNLPPIRHFMRFRTCLES
ncbi:uncharacterized protein LACBIDRAFT_312247 [Laccaria bicolor S238N-H82]|uniref:Predicted protein n=1 Tax=Laccaria bicolor (strain S238N-H82 / ATCC MYA-4686) TaxID=486041 RepID=B0DVT1_LACBS|nr:uncharacterized protein LACBIDRAFT_312247 [Laccaria bicolor S238N-H82]EDR01353.1 predicted protein [Laccaria bicolor S238N-H82]|eukprot:XP_001888060.1 predicted protein [Laccaria bicolor S238N-H82]